MRPPLPRNLSGHMLPLRTHAANRQTHTHTDINTNTHYIEPSTKIIPKATANNPQVASGSQTGYPISNYTQAQHKKKTATPTPKKTHQHSHSTPKKKKKKTSNNKKECPLRVGTPFVPWVGARLWQ